MPRPNDVLDFFRRYTESLRAGTPPDAAEQEKTARTLEEIAQDFQDSLEELNVAEEELRQQNDELELARQMADAAQARYRELFEFAPDGYLVTDHHGIIREANRAAAELLGVAAEYLAGKPLAVFVAENQHREFRHWFDDLIHRTGAQQRELVLWSRKSEPFAASIKVIVRNNGDSHIARLLWMVRDVTKRKAAEEALRQERDFAEALIETAQAIVLVLDREGHILRFNPYFEEVTGRELDDVRGRDWFTLFVPEPERDAARTDFFEAASHGRDGRVIHPILSRDGRLRYIHWSAKWLRDRAGKPSSLLVIGHDVTELNAAQQRALAAERLAAIGQMVSGLSHEGRNALQRSQACLEMLALELRDRPSAGNLVDRIQAAQNHLLLLYEEVQTYAAPLRLNRTTCDLGDLVREAFGRIELLHKGHRLTLREVPGDIDRQCDVDAVLVRRVFCNILDNAAAASANPVAIIVRWAEASLGDRPAVEVALRDDGPGLTNDERDKIFEPFFTTKTHGIGLGMAIAKRIVEAHEGRIGVGSSQGPGTEILVTFPRRRP